MPKQITKDMFIGKIIPMAENENRLQVFGHLWALFSPWGCFNTKVTSY